MVLGNIGELYDEHGQRQEALALYEAALRITLDMGDRAHETHLRMQTGQLLLDEGRVDEARSHLDQALVLGRALSFGRWRGWCKAVAASCCSAKAPGRGARRA
jgi:tetratricopeptide (TPR) repeat protein